MKAIYIAGGRPKNTAVNILKNLLEAKGHRVTRDAGDPLGWDVTLRWGVSYHGNKPAINAGVNQFDKYDCFEEFEKAKVSCPTTISLRRAGHTCGFDFELGKVPALPWLARKRHHVKGKDIVVCKELWDVAHVLQARQHDFFSVFIPTETEFRVMVFQDKAFVIYEKKYKGEGEYEGYMRNMRFGFGFSKRDDLRGNNKLSTVSVKAVKALGMDFGGVDVILGKDGKYYVLEVNSMPHIENAKRSSGIRLANLFSRWAEAL